MPKRIQRKRTKGWKMPPNTVYVGRPTQWGNPYRVGPSLTAQQAVDKYSRFVFKSHGRWWLDEIVGEYVGRTNYPLDELRGKNLACWCKIGQPCHADVLLEVANR